jgi:hypothetical protein
MSRFTSLAIVILVLTGGSIDADPIESMPGLIAWYDVSALHEKLRDGEEVGIWQDSSGNGHTLTDRRDGQPILFETQQVGEKPAMHVRRLNSHALEEPFEFDDHTIFLVASTKCSPCGLLHSTAPGEDLNGILLQGDRGRAFLHAGGSAAPYTEPLDIGGRFAVMVLGRQAGVLHGFVDDRDVSSLAEIGGGIQVGGFFSMSLTRAVKKYSDGLHVSEMIFFDRYLSREERAEVTRYLGEKYEIELYAPAPGQHRVERMAPPNPERVRAHLGLGSAQSVNVAESTFVFWEASHLVDAPFRHDAEEAPERLYCTRDETRVRVRVVLQLATEIAGAKIGLVVVKNNEDWLPDEASSEPLAGGRGKLLLDVFVDLDAGDWISVIAESRGAEGPVTAVPENSEILVEVR